MAMSRKPADSGLAGLARRYPPLLAVVVALALAILALPSALNLPQANPGQTLEYAPVPGDQGNAPNSGTYAGLGQASSGSLGVGDQPGGGPPPEPPPPPQPAENQLSSGGRPPSDKACVGNPPRQTEDRLSPPCVGYFQGDNFGSTYQGVTKDEVRILFHFLGGRVTAVGQTPTSAYIDLNDPPQPNEYPPITYLRNWQRYFNQRFQTYNRRAHFRLFFNDGTLSPETQAKDAADNYNNFKPFAVMIGSGFGVDNDYLDAMARNGVLSWGGLSSVSPQGLSQRYPGLEWNFKPPAEYVGKAFAGWVCSKLKGTNRVFGFLQTTDANQPGYIAMQTAALKQLNACGVVPKDVLKYPSSNSVNPFDTAEEQAAAANIAQFQRDGVTSILWAGGYDVNHSQNAAKFPGGYHPEWFTADDFGGFDSSLIGSIQEQSEWANAWVISPVTLQNSHGTAVTNSCYEAYLSVDPTINTRGFEIEYACGFYDYLVQLFTGIQVSGPRLNQVNVDRGFHAIPAKPGLDRENPACFYNPGDYSCLKDEVAMWWDPSAQTTAPKITVAGSSGSGCYRVAENGLRHLPGQFPGGEPNLQKRADDICNLFTGLN